MEVVARLAACAGAETEVTLMTFSSSTVWFFSSRKSTSGVAIEGGVAVLGPDSFGDWSSKSTATWLVCFVSGRILGEPIRGSHRCQERLEEGERMDVTPA